MSTQDLSMLTERQQTAYMLKESGMKVKQIAEEMGITDNAVRRHLKQGERRFRQDEAVKKMREENAVPVDFPLTRADLLVILSGLQSYTAEMMKRITKNSKSDWAGKLPPEYSLAEDLIARIETNLYDRIDKKPILKWYE